MQLVEVSAQKVAALATTPTTVTGSTRHLVTWDSPVTAAAGKRLHSNRTQLVKALTESEENLLLEAL